MQNPERSHHGSEWLIMIGAGLFIVVLAVSAVWEADIRWLHFFQAWMYIIALALSLRHNRWGYFVGLSAAGLWDYTNLFVTSFFANGLQQFSQWVRMGHIARPDLLIAVPAWLTNFLVILGCAWAYAHLREKRVADVGRFLITFAATTGFFAVDIALFQPRYLALFPRMLHPHLP